MSLTYANALEESNEAIATYGLVKADYFAGCINDDEFLAARTVYIAAVEKFNAAFAKETKW